MSVGPVASMPMYDWLEVREATDALWTAIAGRLQTAGIDAPAMLDRSRKPDSVWRDSGLVLSQTCGFPFSTRLRGMVRLVGTPAYDVAGCEGPRYSSMIVVRDDEPSKRLAEMAGRRPALNNADSLSGYLALRAALVEARLDPDSMKWIETGGHRASVRAVAAGDADIAAIDAVCWAFATRYEPEAVARLRILGNTPLRPGLPFITAVERRDDEVRKIRAAITEAIADPATEVARHLLCLAGLCTTDEFDYGPIAAMGRRSA